VTKVGLPSLGDTIARHGLEARKSLGQHFLLDPSICARIAGLAGDLSGRHVLEVGPGPGGLTRALLETDATSVLAVELDQRAVIALQELVAAHPARLRVLEADALRIDPAEAMAAPRRIIANLPYNIASPLLVRWLRCAAALEGMTLMFQLEVAEPKVWSAVVGFNPHADDPPAAVFLAMEKLTAAAFGQRRKMLRGALKSLGNAEALLDQAGIAGDRRGETLTILEFDRLARLLAGRHTGAPALT